jgi:hypothetical protein
VGVGAMVKDDVESDEFILLIYKIEWKIELRRGVVGLGWNRREEEKLKVD